MTAAIRKYSRDFIALVLLVVLALGIGGYILSNQRLRFPVIEEKPFRLKAELSDAQAVIPGQGQTVRVAGVKVGDLAKVDLDDGRAVVTLDIDPDKKDLIKTDATALLRPKTGVKDMFLEVDPGTEKAPVMKEDGMIPVQNTAPDIDPDEILAALDVDARDYLKLLIAGGGKGLDGRGEDLEKVFERFEPLHRDLAKVTTAIAERRGNLSRLVHNYGSLIEEVGDRDGDLERLVASSQEVFETFASEDDNVSSFIAKLPPTLRQATETLPKVERLGNELGPSLESLRPAVRQLDKTNKQVLPFVKEAEPILRKQIRPFVREARPYVRDLQPAAKNLNIATPDLTESFNELNRFFNMAAHNPKGREKLTGNLDQDLARDEGYLYWAAWVAQNTTGIFPTSDASGPFRRSILVLTCDTALQTLEGEVDPRLGLPAATGLGSLLGFDNILRDTGICPKAVP
ncbi:MAG: MCE family protein [Thermoleophilaceae bacterium]|nr:MCE family protein [Thermoleophilaceae bacterium]